MAKKLLVIAKIIEGNQHVGYRLIDMNSREVMDYERQEIARMCMGKAYEIVNLEYDEERNKLSLANMPVREWDIKFPEIKRTGGRYAEPDEHSLKAMFILGKGEKYLTCNCLGETYVFEKLEPVIMSGVVFWNVKVETTPLGAIDIWDEDEQLYLHNKEAKEYIRRNKLLGLPVLNMVDLVEGGVVVTGCGEVQPGGTITIPDCVREIKAFAFTQLNSATTVILGKNVRVIGERAFWAIPGLRIQLNDKLEKLCKGAFHECRIVGKLEIPASVKEIEQAFSSACIEEIEVHGDGLLETPSGMHWLMHIPNVSARNIFEPMSLSCKRLTITEKLAVKIIRYFCNNLKNIVYYDSNTLYSFLEGDMIKYDDGSCMGSIAELENIGELHRDKRVTRLKIDKSRAEKDIQYMLSGYRYGIEEVKIIMA